MKLAYLVYSPAEQFSINLQAKDTPVSEGIGGVYLLKSHYMSLRNDSTFTAFYRNILESAGSSITVPGIERCHRDLKVLNHTTSHILRTCIVRHTYFEALEHAVGEIEKRLDQSDLSTVSEVESLLIDAANGKNIAEVSSVVTEYFQGKVDIPHLVIQLQMLPDAVRTAFLGSASDIKEVTDVRTIAETLNQSNIITGMLGEVDKLFRAYLTVSVTSATAERSFSSLHRIKTYLRSSNPLILQSSKYSSIRTL